VQNGLTDSAKLERRGVHGIGESKLFVFSKKAIRAPAAEAPRSASELECEGIGAQEYTIVQMRMQSPRLPVCGLLILRRRCRRETEKDHGDRRESDSFATSHRIGGHGRLAP